MRVMDIPFQKTVRPHAGVQCGQIMDNLSSALAARSSAFHDLPAGKVCIGEPAEPRYDRFAGAEEEGKVPV